MQSLNDSKRQRGVLTWVLGALVWAIAFLTPAFAGSTPAPAPGPGPGRNTSSPGEEIEGVPSTRIAGPVLVVVGQLGQVSEVLGGLRGGVVVQPLDPDQPEGLVVARIFGDFELSIDREVLERAELGFALLAGDELAGALARLRTARHSHTFALDPVTVLPLGALYGAAGRGRFGIVLEAEAPFGGCSSQLGMRVRGHTLELRQRVSL